jgi:hypothetical protein
MTDNAPVRHSDRLVEIMREAARDIGCPGGPKAAGIWERVGVVLNNLDDRVGWRTRTTRDFEDYMESTWAEWVTVAWACLLDDGSCTTPPLLRVVRCMLGLPRNSVCHWERKGPLCQRALDVCIALAHAAPRRPLRCDLLHLLHEGKYDASPGVGLMLRNDAVERVVRDMLEDCVAAQDVSGLLALLRVLTDFGNTEGLSTGRRHMWERGALRLLDLCRDGRGGDVTLMNFLRALVRTKLPYPRCFGYVVPAVLETMFAHLDSCHCGAEACFFRWMVWQPGMDVVKKWGGSGDRALPKAAVASVVRFLQRQDIQWNPDCMLLHTTKRWLNDEGVQRAAPVHVATVLVAWLHRMRKLYEDPWSWEGLQGKRMWSKFCKALCSLVACLAAPAGAAALDPLRGTRFVAWAVDMVSTYTRTGTCTCGAADFWRHDDVGDWRTRVFQALAALVVAVAGLAPLQDHLTASEACAATGLVSLRRYGEADDVHYDGFPEAVTALVPLWCHDPALEEFAHPRRQTNAVVQHALQACRRWGPLRQLWCAAVYRGRQHARALLEEKKNLADAPSKRRRRQRK